MNSPYAFADIFKNSFDLSQLINTQRRNIEAFTAANQAVVEGAQAISRRQAEVLREQVEQGLKASRDMMTGGAPEANISKQAEFAKSMFENALSNVREVTEMVTKSSFEAFDLLNKRASESLEEITRAGGQAVNAAQSAASQFKKSNKA